MTNITDDYKKAKEVKTGTPMLQLRNTTGTNQLHINQPQCNDWIKWLDANELISDFTDCTKYTGDAQ